MHALRLAVRLILGWLAAVLAGFAAAHYLMGGSVALSLTVPVVGATAIMVYYRWRLHISSNANEDSSGEANDHQ